MFKIRQGICAFAVIVSSCSCLMTSWAGQWAQQDGGWVYEEDDGTLATGWNQIDGKWYYLDSGSGSWIEKPALTAENIFYLLQNYLSANQLYQNEEAPLEIRVNEENAQSIEVSLGYEDVPLSFKTINTYKIDKKTGETDPVVGKDFNIWM